MGRMQLPVSPHIVISPYQRVAEVLARERVGHVISILGKSDRLEWPSTGTRPTLRLEFDDTNADTELWRAPTQDEVRRLIEFARDWNGLTHLLVHCRAGSSRSPAAAAIAVAAIGRPDLIEAVLLAKTYHRPNQLMLRLADRLLSPTPELERKARAIQHPPGNSKWEPVGIPLGPAPA